MPKNRVFRKEPVTTEIALTRELVLRLLAVAPPLDEAGEPVETPPDVEGSPRLMDASVDALLAPLGDMLLGSGQSAEGQTAVPERPDRGRELGASSRARCPWLAVGDLLDRGGHG